MSDLEDRIAATVRQVVRQELKVLKDEMNAELDELRTRIAQIEVKSGVNALAAQTMGHDLEPVSSYSGRSVRSMSSDSLCSVRSGSPSPTLLPTILSKVGARVHRALSHSSSNPLPSFSQLPQSLVPLPFQQQQQQQSTPPAQPPQQQFLLSTAGVNGPVVIRKNSGLSAKSAEQHLKDPLRAHNYFMEGIPSELMKDGLPFLRVTHKKKVQRVLRLDLESGTISWNMNKSSAKIFLDRICEIYAAEEARMYREELRVSAEMAPQWITIIHQRPGDSKLKALHMVMNTQTEFDLLLSCLFQLVTYRREVMSGLAVSGEKFVDIHWTRSTQTSDEKLSFQQVVGLCNQLHVNATKQFIRSVFEEADTDDSGYLDFDEFKGFVKLLKQRSDINRIYRKHRIGESRDALVKFVSEVQQECWENVQEFVSEGQGALAEDEFVDLLVSSKAFPVLNRSLEDTLAADLDQPLNEYWISSSHNTYLTGRQVVDSSSVESYVRALQDGCRCLEIDCWDGPKGPIVYHGASLARLTSAISFDDVIESVLKYGFISSPFPIILSLEIRCNDANQRYIAKTLREVLAGLLVTQPLSNHRVSTLPSPNELKHRVLIKVKSSKSQAEPSSESLVNTGESSSSDETFSGVEEGAPKVKKAQKVIPELAELGVYLSGYTFRGFNTPEAQSPYHIFSFSEKTLRSRLYDSRRSAEVINHNKTHLSRVYPSPYRITSSNFDPIPFWQAGVQMVALNWQRNDIGMQLNNAFFSPRVGYVLKPDWLRPGHHLVDRRYHTISIEVISAQQLPRPTELRPEEILSPYVVVQLYGLAENDALPQYQSEVVEYNGFNPVWNLSFKLSAPATSLPFICARFCIGTGEHLFAFHTVRLVSIGRGYRHIPLQNAQGEDYIFSSLFIKTSID